jgi:hypothetical protein
MPKIEPTEACKSMFKLYDECQQIKHELSRKREELMFAPDNDSWAGTAKRIEILDHHLKKENNCHQLKQIAMFACNITVDDI